MSNLYIEKDMMERILLARNQLKHILYLYITDDIQSCSFDR